MGRFDSAGRTGGSGGASEAFQIESDDESFALNAGKSEVGSVGSTRRGGSIGSGVRNASEQFVLEFVAERGNALGVFRERNASELYCLAEADDAGNVFSAGSDAALVMSAVEKLTKTCAATNVKCADAFGRVELVAGDGEKIDAKSVDVERNFSGGLHGVGVEKDIVLRGDLSDLLERLNGAEFIVGVHYGDERSLWANRVADGFRIDEPVFIDREVSDLD